MHFYYNILWTDICAHEGTPCYILDSCTTIVIPYNTILTYQIGSRVTERKRAREAKIEKKARWREKQRDRGRICLTYPASQSCSVWSRGRYLIPRLSNSASTSSGIRPLTRTAYIPRTYFAMENGRNWWPRSKGKT